MYLILRNTLTSTQEYFWQFAIFHCMCTVKCNPNREFTLELKKRKTIQEIDGSHGLPCAPCRELVVRQFVGGPMGENAWLIMVCSQST